MSLTMAFMVASLTICAYLLVVLHWAVRKTYAGIWAWRFIFCGYSILMGEVVWGIVVLAGSSSFYHNWVLLRWGNEVFAGLMLVKLLCYAVGFTLWERQRRMLLVDPPK